MMKSELVAGRVYRFQPSILSARKLTIKVVAVGLADDRYAVVHAYRVRPNQHNVTFGSVHVYAIVLDRTEAV